MPAFKFESKKATFHISGEKLIIAANQTYLRTHGLDDQGEYRVKTEYFSYPEVSIVVGILNKLGYVCTRYSSEEKEHFSFKNDGEIKPELVQMFSTICIMQDLISLGEGVKLINDFVKFKNEAANADNFYSFFVGTNEETSPTACCTTDDSAKYCS